MSLVFDATLCLRRKSRRAYLPRDFSLGRLDKVLGTLGDPCHGLDCPSANRAWNQPVPFPADDIEHVVAEACQRFAQTRRNDDCGPEGRLTAESRQRA